MERNAEHGTHFSTPSPVRNDTTTLMQEGERKKIEALDYLGLRFTILNRFETSGQNERLQDELAAAERTLRIESELSERQ